MQVRETADGRPAVAPPSYRIDIEREIDLVEEVARLKGFDAIPASMPIARVVSDLPTLPQRLERTVRDILVAHGMNEIINFSFTSPDAADKLLLAADDLRRTAIKLANPAGGRAVRHADHACCRGCWRSWRATPVSAPWTSGCSRSAAATCRRPKRCRTNRSASPGR